MSYRESLADWAHLHAAIVQPGSNMCVCGEPDDHPVHTMRRHPWTHPDLADICDAEHDWRTTL